MLLWARAGVPQLACIPCHIVLKLFLQSSLASSARPESLFQFQSSAAHAQDHSEQECLLQEQGSSNPQALLQQLQASAQGSPHQQAMLIRMLQDSMLGAAAREPLAARVLLGIPIPCSASNHSASGQPV